jgi:hypothetical protein
MEEIHGKRDQHAIQHKQNSIHTQVRYPKRTKSDIWLICSGHQGPQGGKKTHQINRWGDQIEYPGDKSTRTAGLTTAKIIINSVISTLGAKFLVIDIHNFYLNTPLGWLEYMVINLASLPQERIEKYDLIELSQDVKVYIEIQKGMYGLPQAGILANELLQHNLTKDGYRPTTHTHGLWTHDTRPISFSLVVDNFGVK